MNAGTRLIQHSIVLFWALWTSIVTITDAINLLQKLNLMPEHLKFTSGNYDLVLRNLSIYHLNVFSVAIFLFTVIVLWALIIAVLFWKALFYFKKNAQTYFNTTCFAFAILLAMHFVFILADEILIQYPLEHGHMARTVFIFVSFLTFFFLAKRHEE